jgi:hypothetical protein
LLDVLCEELKLSGADDLLGFNKSLGSITSEKGNEYFDRTKDDKPGSVEAVEAWQILSPLRGMSFGVSDINRQIHERFRRVFLILQRASIAPFPSQWAQSAWCMGIR